MKRSTSGALTSVFVGSNPTSPARSTVLDVFSCDLNKLNRKTQTLNPYDLCVMVSISVYKWFAAA